jgi:hypothetical protein
MPRKDALHDAVKNALIKEGWTITHDPYKIEYRRDPLYVDLGAEAPLAAEKEGRKIAVEVKSFLGKSGITDLYTAVGQFLFYRLLMESRDPERTLFLAMPTEAYGEILDEKEGQAFIESEKLRLVLYDPENEVLERWIE